MLSCCDVMLPTPNPLLERVAVGALPTNASYSWTSCLAAPSEVWKDATQEAAGSKGFPIRTPLSFSGFLSAGIGKIDFCLRCSTWIMIPRLSFLSSFIYKNMKVFLKTCGFVTGGRKEGNISGRNVTHLSFCLNCLGILFWWTEMALKNPAPFEVEDGGGTCFMSEILSPNQVKLKINESDGCRNQVSTVSHYWASFRYQLIGQLYRWFHVGSVCFVVFGWWSRCSLKWCSYSFPSGSQLKQCQGAIKVTVHWQSRQDGYLNMLPCSELLFPQQV